MAGMLDFFTKEYDTNGASSEQEPFFTMKGKSEQEILKWLNDELIHRARSHEAFFNTCYSNLQAYKGDYYKRSGQRQSDSNLDRPFVKTSKYCVNHLYEMTENMVSQMTRVKPAVEVMPANDEFEDKNSARAVKLLVQHLWYVNDIDLLIQKLHRQRLIFGESFLCVDWDKRKGDLHPDYIILRNAEMLNKDGSIPTNLKEKSVKVGDVRYRSILPWNIYLENKEEYSEVQNAFVKESMHIAEVKRLYPKTSKSNRKNKSIKEYSLSTLKKETVYNKVNVFTFFQKASDEFPNGRKIVFLEDMILQDEDLGFSHGDLPFLRLVDLEVPGSLHGMSRYQQVLNMQVAHNNLSQAMMKNEFLMGAPKWMMPRGACKIEQLGNGPTIVQYQGPVAPQLVQMNPTSPTTFNFRSQIATELGQGFGVHPVSRGEPPRGITAAVAMQFLNEQETERSISDISRHNNFVRDLAIISISVAGDRYDINDGRMLRILGKENKHLLKFFDVAHLHKDYDVRINNSSALPQSQSAKMERIIQTMQYAPQMFTPERWAELLEFGSIDKMHSLATEAIQSAESAVQDLLEGNFVGDPEEWEDLITHLRIYYQAMQKRSFKEDVPNHLRENFNLHVETTERLAAEKAKINPLFASKLAQIELYPIFWQEAVVPPSTEHQQAVVQGQANRGEPVDGQIPATEPKPLGQ